MTALWMGFTQSLCVHNKTNFICLQHILYPHTYDKLRHGEPPLIGRFMGPKWSPPGTARSQEGLMLATLTLLSGTFLRWSCPNAPNNLNWSSLYAELKLLAVFTGCNICVNNYNVYNDWVYIATSHSSFFVTEVYPSHTKWHSLIETEWRICASVN